MKISDKVVEKYLVLCPFSSQRSNSFNEIEDKIVRAVRIGKTIRKEKKRRVIGYHNLNFVVRDNVVINMWKDTNEAKYTYINEKLKYTYDKYELKVMV